MCEQGPVVSVWPEGKVYAKISEKDLETIIQNEM